MRTKKWRKLPERGEGDESADWGGDLKRKIRFIHTRTRGDNVKEVWQRLDEFDERLTKKIDARGKSSRKVVVDFVFAGRFCDQRTTHETSKLLIASIIQRSCLRLNWKAEVRRASAGLMNREFFIRFRASLAQLSALRPHTQSSHHECFPSRFAVLFLLQEIFLLSVLCFAFSPSAQTQNIFLIERTLGSVGVSVANRADADRKSSCSGVNFVSRRR